MGKASYLAFGLLTISLLVSTITLGVLYGKEKDNTQNNPKGWSINRLLTKSFFYFYGRLHLVKL